MCVRACPAVTPARGNTRKPHRRTQLDAGPQRRPADDTAGPRPQGTGPTRRQQHPDTSAFGEHQQTPRERGEACEKPRENAERDFDTDAKTRALRPLREKARRADRPLGRFGVLAATRRRGTQGRGDATARTRTGRDGSGDRGRGRGGRVHVRKS